VERIRVSGNRIKFNIPVPQMNTTANFSGTLDPDTDILSASVAMPNMPGAQELAYHRRVSSLQGEGGVKKYLIGSGPVGVWQGYVRAPDGDETLVTLVLEIENGEYTATLEDPFVDMVRGQNVKVNDTLISFTFRPTGSDYPSHFTGTYVAGADRVTGSFSQRGVSRFVKFDRDPTTVMLGTTADGQIIEPARVRHQHKFGLTGRFSYWPALHMVKDETYNINNLTTSQWSIDGTVRWWAMDAFAILFRGYRGSQGFTDDETKLAPFETYGLTSESTMKLDGWEFGVTGYLGNVLSEDSHFNPYVTGVGGKVSWEVNTSDRGSDLVSINDDPLLGKDWAFGFGLGTEYELTTNFNLEFEWMWRYFKTEDELIWKNVDEDWSNTHVWALSFGVTYMFF
jgi:opacity protein-like surface antigen